MFCNERDELKMLANVLEFNRRLGLQDEWNSMQATIMKYRKWIIKQGRSKCVFINETQEKKEAIKETK